MTGLDLLASRRPEIHAPENRRRIARAYRETRRAFPMLPHAECGSYVTLTSHGISVHTWCRHGFEIKRVLSERRGPFIEIGGPTPLWGSSGDLVWGEAVDMQDLPQPLLVTNVLSFEDALIPVYGNEFAGAFVLRADGTQLPVQNRSVGALFCRGLSVIQSPMSWEIDQRRSSVVRAMMFEEARRVLEPGGLLFNHGANRIDLAFPQYLGLTLQYYRGGKAPGSEYAPYGETVFTAP